mmetsp:Transcript_63318/g.151051  ORF Transcript_63318/g.151051 Transcript_63318/m.151051 type:complete len:497 (+) Transcript_63318:158-1648(+)|eukprot:CAMPEP_0178389820 /NCGR_PEP_ID=MMETSP0689_2-20121128/10324_1 /TAXON_ID=160604 /ORGANISM="Amphidinium massartii, Strain CS-259" /LENGTH=496 /DNA_ID=CAMNT_0020010303 /DNA_START=83 /DNA_END=1573 /DNA_ORIENTATION=-
MNWPPLSPECSDAIAAVLRDVVRTKPSNPLDQVAQKLQQLSGLDPAAFEEGFNECKARPRMYVLEDVCPPNADPYSWVPMRYNDDTILDMLAQRVADVVADVLSPEMVTDFAGFMQRVNIAFPEASYLRGSPQAVLFAQTFRAFYLVASGSPQVIENLDDENPELAFSCPRLVEWGRSQVHEMSRSVEWMVEALAVGCLLRVVAQNPSFQQRLGGSSTSPDIALLHALSNAPEAMPSYVRLTEDGKRVVVASLQVQFPIRLLFTTEAVPYHFQRVKDVLASFEGGLPYVLSIMAIEHVAHLRMATVSDEEIDIKRICVQSLEAVEKRQASRAYELLLKKRAERQSWRLVRDDYLMRAVIRLCCFAGLDGKQQWGEMQIAVEKLSPSEQEILKSELGRKDGLSEVPCFVLHGANAFMTAAMDNANVGQSGAIKLLVRVLLELQQQHKSVSASVIDVKLSGLVALCRSYTDAAPLDEMPFVVEPSGVNRVSIRTSFGA